MLWIGHRGIVSNLHYDRSHNFFAQIRGTKRWTLFPPSQHSSVYLYPSLHPHYRQTQVDFETYRRDDFPRTAGLNGRAVFLEPGDLMYVPPYWFHRVEALSLSVSLSILNPSEEEKAYAMAHWKAPPASWETDPAGSAAAGPGRPARRSSSKVSLRAKVLTTVANVRALILATVEPASERCGTTECWHDPARQATVAAFVDDFLRASRYAHMGDTVELIAAEVE